MKFNSNANKLKKTIDTTNKIGLGLGVVNTGLAIKTLLSDNESDDNKETKNNNEDLAKDFYEKLDNSNQKKYGGVLNNNNDMKRKKRQYGNRFANGSFLNPQTNNLYGNDMNLFNGLPIPQQQNPFQPLQQQNQRNINFNN